MTRRTNGAVYLDVSNAVRDIVNWAMGDFVSDVVDVAISDAVNDAVRNTVGGVVYDAVCWTTYDSAHSSLQEFLRSYLQAGVETH